LSVAALLLTGSSRASATYSDPAAALPGILEVQRLNLRARSLYDSQDYHQARALFIEAAGRALSYGDTRSAAMNWNNAGVSSFGARQYRASLSEFQHAQFLAEQGHHNHARLFILNSLADFYDLTGQPENALLIARQALDLPFGEMDHDMRARLLCQVGNALGQLKRFDESVPYYLHGINALLDIGDYNIATRALAAMGDYGVSSNHLAVAEWALSRGLNEWAREHAYWLGPPKDGSGKTGGSSSILRCSTARASEYSGSLDDLRPAWQNAAGNEGFP
jgi:tetratricopeptide (TPR) repeat protein